MDNTNTQPKIRSGTRYIGTIDCDCSEVRMCSSGSQVILACPHGPPRVITCSPIETVSPVMIEALQKMQDNE